MIGMLGLLAGLALLIILALRGVSVIFASVLATLVVIVTNGLDPAQSFATDFTSGPLGAFTFAGRFFPLFLSGAVFGRVMADSRAAESIAVALADSLGASRALWIITLACALLTYGGVVVFVVIFAVYPLGQKLIEKAGIPKHLLAGAVALGAGTFTMTALPGSPSIHNIIAASALHTDLFAAPILGIVGGAMMFILGMWYLERERLRLTSGNEPMAVEKPEHVEGRPHWIIASIPIAMVLALIIAPRLLVQFTNPGAESFLMWTQQQPLIWPSVALGIGSLVGLALSKSLWIEPMITFGKGANEAVMPLMATAVVVGFGGVVSQTAGFAIFRETVLGLPLPPVVNVGIAANIVSGLVGSSSGGLQIFMATLGQSFLDMGMAPQTLHRIAAIASGGLDSLPHCGAVITLLTVMGLTHKEAYKDIFMVSVVVPLITVSVLILGVIVF